MWKKEERSFFNNDVLLLTDVFQNYNDGKKLDMALVHFTLTLKLILPGKLAWKIPK